MATIEDLGMSAAINLLSTFIFLLAFSFLKVQPMNERVYFPKWYIKGVRRGDDFASGRSYLTNLVNLDFKAYLHFLDWMKEAMQMSEAELIEHAGLDSAVYVRIYLLGLKIFIPLMLTGLFVILPINATDQSLSTSTILSTDIDKVSLANVATGSKRLWVDLCMAYLFTAWTCFMLYREYETISRMRLRFLSGVWCRPDQFTVLVQKIPPDPNESISVQIDNFFKLNHPDHYLGHQVVYNANYLAKLVRKREGLQNWLDFYQLKHARNNHIRPTIKQKYLGLWGAKIDAIDYYIGEVSKLTDEIIAERERVLHDRGAKMPTAFVYFKTRWGAAVCAQTWQTRNPMTWLTEIAPEPRNIYWNNLAIPRFQLHARKFVVSVAVFFLIFFFVIPVAFVQSLANLETVEEKFTFLKPLVQKPYVKAFLQGFLPGLVLKIFLLLLPMVLMIMSEIEGFISFSELELVTAAKYYYFIVVNIFVTTIIAGAAFQQLQALAHQSPTGLTKLLGNNVPLKAKFFITYIMIDGWAAVAADMLRLKPLISYHIMNLLFVKTERDREKAMAPGSACFYYYFPQIQLYFLLGLIYAVLSPFVLPFIVVYFAFSYIVYRHQVINVYDPQYESAAAFWPHIHNRIIASMIIEQLTLIGVFTTKMVASFIPLLCALLALTILFYFYCKRHFEEIFENKDPLEDARQKDLMSRTMQADIKSYLKNAYLHPIFKDEKGGILNLLDREPPLITRRMSISE